MNKVVLVGRTRTAKSPVDIGMAKATLVRNHFQDMIACLKELVLSETTVCNSQVDEIPESLSDSFN